MAENVRAHVIIHGKVQGVFFRAETQRAAEHIGGLAGWVKNRPEGTVEAVFEGDKKLVNQIIEWCHKGSPHSHVDKVDVEWESLMNEFSSFDVRYS